LALALAAAAGSLAPAAAAGRCAQVPWVSGVDQSPSDPRNYGKCTKALEPQVNAKFSHWCKFNTLGTWPTGPSARAKKCLKFGRATIYRVSKRVSRTARRHGGGCAAPGGPQGAGSRPLRPQNLPVFDRPPPKPCPLNNSRAQSMARLRATRLPATSGCTARTRRRWWRCPPST
jgi:hypothetical protein